VAIEKTLQTVMEEHLEVFLGVRLLASEYMTGKVHGGRIDSLGIDELGSPVIIEYKRGLHQNVINQGLFYLDWLLDHKAEFEMLTLKQLGTPPVVDWNNPRLLCIASDFTRYDEYAVQQINRNIALLRYKKFGEEILMLELVNATTSTTSAGQPSTAKPAKGTVAATVTGLLAQADPVMTARFTTLKDYMLSLGDDVQMKTLKLYFAFVRIKNFACVEVHPQSKKILAYLKLDPDDVTLEPGFSRDVRHIGHFGTGDLEVTIDSDEDVERAKELILRSYEAS
jgi:predicted transport protein